MKNSRFLKEIKRIKGYEKYMDPAYFEDDMSGMLNQLVYVLDFRTMSFIHLSKNVKEVFGLEYDYIVENGPMAIYSHTPEEDTELLDKYILKAIAETAFSEKDHEPENLRFAYNFRLRTDDGHLRCLLNRFSILIYGEKGVPLVVVGTMTDVSQLYDKRELFCEGTRFESDGTSSIILHKVFPLQNGKTQPNLSKKEIEVLKLVMEGYISKEIAQKTNRSIETIHTHRKNILKKMKCNNITEAVSVAKEANWL